MTRHRIWHDGYRWQIRCGTCGYACKSGSWGASLATLHRHCAAWHPNTSRPDGPVGGTER